MSYQDSAVKPQEETTGLRDDELEAEEGFELPQREEMSLIREPMHPALPVPIEPLPME